MQPIKSDYRLFVFCADALQTLILLIFRLSWGWQFFVTGKGKLLNHKDVADFFAGLHIPFPGLNAWFIGGLECIGGLLLMVGFASRPIAFLLACAMTVAYLSVDEERTKLLNIFQDPTPFLTADPFFFLLTSVLVLAFGPGLISIDALLSKLIGNSKSKNASNKMSL